MILMLESKATIMPALTICPSYDSSYSLERLQSLGIPSKAAYRKEGVWVTNKSTNPEAVFNRWLG